MKSVAVKRISPGSGNYFFGYYDLQPFNKDMSLHLAHKPSFIDRLQREKDSCEIGFIEMATGKYEKFDTTYAWNFQQGSMLQWNPKAPDREIVYNKVIDGEHCGVVADIYTGKKRYLEKPVANVSKDGRYGISINMSRLYDFRPGYGYAFPKDPFYDKNHSADDGVFIIDMDSGKAKLVLSMEEIWDATGHFFGKDQKMIINHITFNPSGKRFLALVRNFVPKGEQHSTAILTANRDGSDMYHLSDYGFQSHYFWLNDNEVAFYSEGKELACSQGKNNYVLKDKTHDGYMMADGYFVRDNHMSFTDDGKLMITDCYPYFDGFQKIMLYSTERNICSHLGWFRPMPVDCVDVRCDLHPRWNRSYDSITFDSTHEGFRGIYKMDLPWDVIKEVLGE